MIVKKTIFSFLVLSLLALITSIIVFLTNKSLYLFFDLLASSLFGITVFFSLYNLEKYKNKFLKPFFFFGILLLALFLFGIYTPQNFNSIWPIISLGALIMVTTTLLQPIKNQKDILASVARFNIVMASLSISAIVLSNFSNPLIYSIISLNLIIGSITLLISIVKNN